MPDLYAGVAVGLGRDAPDHAVEHGNSPRNHSEHKKNKIGFQGQIGKYFVLANSAGKSIV
jgi:hypothetical protein